MDVHPSCSSCSPVAAVGAHRVDVAVATAGAVAGAREHDLGAGRPRALVACPASRSATPANTNHPKAAARSITDPAYRILGTCVGIAARMNAGAAR
jgi:hypothetical protein